MAEIFLLEDSRSLRNLLIAELRAAGHNVTAFEDGSATSSPEMLDATEMVIADIRMPGVDGIEAIENIRGTHPEMPVIVMSGKQVKLPERFKVDAILKKPFNSEALIQKIDQLLSEPSAE